MSKRTVLVVDDEANIRELARLYLERNDFRVVTAERGDEALTLVERVRPDLLVLDLMLPGVDGWEVCRRVRAGSDVPILMLTARDDDVDKMVARVRAILRRSAPEGPSGDAPRRVADVVVDPAAREVKVGGRPVSLRPKEFELLLALVDHLNLVLTRDQLLDQVWGYEYYGATRTVDVHVAQLRDKLADSGLQIETIWGVGYKLVEKEGR